MTDLDIYQPAAIEGYQPRMVMDEKTARALDDQVRRCTEAVLREGTDYGVIPGTSGEKTLWRPGAQKLLQWFGLGFSCERVEVERDGDGRKHGITYRATVARRLPDGTLDIKATCEGTADYDESKFYKSAEQVQREAETKERKWAEQYKRPPRPTFWQGLAEYRAPWNSLMKRAQKRAIVGAVVDATAAGGIFSEREEDDGPVPPDGGPTWYEQALEVALSFTDRAAGDRLYADAARAFRDSQCTGRQKDHVQNRVRQRQERLRTVTVTDVEDLGRTQDPAPAAQDAGPAAGAVPAASRGLLTLITNRLARLGAEEEHHAAALEKLAGRDITGDAPLTRDEGTRIRELLAQCADHAALIELLAADGQEGGTDG